MELLRSAAVVISARLGTVTLALLLLAAAEGSPATAACTANGKACGVSSATGDRLCCPGSICGPWGNVCQPGCRIGGVAYRAGTRNPANACQVCDPSRSTRDWSPATAATACNDGNPCTSDRCDAASGRCVSTPIVCDDRNSCTVDRCEPGSGCVSAPVACDDGDLCTTDGCDPGSGCVFTSVDCNDGDLCTTDGCDPGSGCVFTSVDCDDGDPCTSDSCEPTSAECSHAPAEDGTACDDQIPCTTDDRCGEGICAGTAVTCTPLDSCHGTGECDPSTGVCSSPELVNGSSCTDHDECTADDACLEGVCVGEPLCQNLLSSGSFNVNNMFPWYMRSFGLEQAWASFDIGGIAPGTVVSAQLSWAMSWTDNWVANHSMTVYGFDDPVLAAPDVVGHVVNTPPEGCFGPGTNPQDPACPAHAAFLFGGRTPGNSVGLPPCDYVGTRACAPSLDVKSRIDALIAAGSTRVVFVFANSNPFASVDFVGRARLVIVTAP